MTPTEIVVLLIVAAVCGGIGQKIAGRGKGGCLTSIALGFIGALLGPRLAEILGLPELWILHVGDTRFPIIWSIIGSALFVAILGFISGRRSGRS
ncbi:MAG: hypothetical protein HY812_19110 [Planctomycetes bacterium]|nr:hypothetical protein [Planctomycetota bacterium]